MAELKFCPECGGAVERHLVAGLTRNHWYCQACDERCYDHPMVVVTCFVACEDRLLWVQRELEPQRGLWSIPGGFLENGETLAEGAARELHEEAGVLIPASQLQLYMTGTITFINQIYVAFRATVDTDACLPGVESRDCQYFSRAQCPWDQVAYPQVNDSIIQAYDDLESGRFGLWHAQMTESHYEFLPVRQMPL
ncbi:MAG: NUDIX domain-containing protein [Halioglobus sp.]